MPHHHPARIARQTAGRSRGNAHAVLEDRLAGLIGVGQHRSIDVDHHLVALTGGAGIKPLVERRLRDQSQGIRLLLGRARGIRGWVTWNGRLFAAGPLVERLARRGERLREQHSHFRLEPPPHDHHAVCVLVDMKRATGVPLRRLPRLGLPVHLPPATHDPLDVVGRALAPNRQQLHLGLRRSHTGQGSDLRIRQLPSAERLGQERQRPECARDPDPLARRAPGEPHAPAQPGGAGAKASVPSRSLVELSDQSEKLRDSGVEVRGQRGNLVAKSIEVRGMILSGNGSRRIDLHGEFPPSCWGDSTP